MSLSVTVSQLETLVRRAESLADAIYQIKACQSEEHYRSLENLRARLHEATARIESRIEGLEEGRAERVREEGGTFLSQIEQTRTSIIERSHVKSVAAFKKNIKLIFEGPKDSALDAGWVISRNKQTRKRCGVIRELNPDGLISWAAALPPSAWMAGCMQNHLFDHLVEEIEPEETQVWPQKMVDILHIFGVEELAQSQEYHAFLNDFDTQSRSKVTSISSKKRKRILEDAASNIEDSPGFGDAQKSRQIQYMFSKAPRDLIHMLGSPLSEAVQASNQWKMEESAGESTTECMTTLVTDGENEDISITLWVGRREGAKQTNAFNLQRTWSALSTH